MDFPAGYEALEVCGLGSFYIQYYSAHFGYRMIFKYIEEISVVIRWSVGGLICPFY